MNSTALGAENTKKESIIFISEAHEKFYYEKLKEVRYQDVYHKALCYCLGINDDTRRNANRIYDFKTGCVKTECLQEGWQTSGSVKVVRMALIYIAMPHQAWMITRTQRSKLTSADSTQWRNYSAVSMHHIFGRQYKSGIRNMQPITGNCMPCLEERIDVKGSIDGNKE